MNTGVKFVLGIVLAFAVFATGFWLGRNDIPYEMIDGYYRDGYKDGLSDGAVDTDAVYAAGYADGHAEAQSHSEKYDELMQQAYEATNGTGAGFIHEDGKVYIEETAPNGTKVKVLFAP